MVLTDGAGQCLWVNRRWAEITGLGAEESRGDGWLRAVHAGDQERVASGWARAAGDDGPVNVKCRLPSARGRTTRAILTAIAIRGPSGELLNVLGTVTDVSARERVDRALSERVKELTCLYSLSRIVEGQQSDRRGMLEQAVALIPPAWQYPEITCARILCDGEQWVTARFRPTHWKLSAPIVVRDQPVGVVEVYYLQEKPELAEGPFLREERSLLDEIALRLSDALERLDNEASSNRLREELAHVARVASLGELTASLAHELTQPVAGIVSNAQAAQRFLAAEQPDLGEVREALAEIVEDGMRAGAVIQRLRSLLGGSTPHPCRLGINDVLKEVLGLVHSESVDKGISIGLELADGLAPVIADRVRLQQVVLNLVINGFDAMCKEDRPPRRLEIRTSEGADDSITVSISDTGIGFRDSDEARLFDPFFTTKPDGLGMGLSISRTIVENYGGRMWAVPNRERGATFHFSLPVAGHEHR